MTKHRNLYLYEWWPNMFTLKKYCCWKVWNAHFHFKLEISLAGHLREVPTSNGQCDDKNTMKSCIYVKIYTPISPDQCNALGYAEAPSEVCAKLFLYFYIYTRKWQFPCASTFIKCRLIPFSLLLGSSTEFLITLTFPPLFLRLSMYIICMTQ